MPANQPTSASQTSIIVIGLGNPVLGDDGVGWRVADEVEAALGAARAAGRTMPAVRIERLGVGGLTLMETVSGYDAAIFIDAAQFPGRPLGEVRSGPFSDLEGGGAGHLDSAHDVSLDSALELGRRLGADLPDRIDTVTIQIEARDEFAEGLSPAVQASVPAAAAAVMKLLEATG
ncbi:MAG TPA: hydrogenase maturation protease [Candidatus Limnocylindrales bacterium]